LTRGQLCRRGPFGRPELTTVAVKSWSFDRLAPKAPHPRLGGRFRGLQLADPMGGGDIDAVAAINLQHRKPDLTRLARAAILVVTVDQTPIDIAA